MRCYAIPYEGEQKYIFFSYCHDDAAQVFPVIERLAVEGYRVWFDDGIHPGEDWPEVIARHMSCAAACIAAVSGPAAESHNCRNELSFALASNKPLLSIILEDFSMPLGMQLQLSSARYLKKNGVPEEAFYGELLSAPLLAPCRDGDGGADPAALALWQKHAAEYGAGGDKAPNQDPAKAAEQLWFSGGRKSSDVRRPEAAAENPAAEKPKAAAAEIPALKEPEAASAESRPAADAAEEAPPAGELFIDDGAETVMLTPPEEDDEERTIMIGAEPEDEEEGRTVLGARYNPALFLRVKTGEIFPIKNERTVLGRSKAKADLAFSDNMEISGRHAEIWRKGTGFALRNFKPTNETIVNGQTLQENECVDLTPCSEILLADETFFLVFGEAYDRVFDEQKICLLKSRDTGETKLIAEDSLPLDRHHKWRGDVLGDPRIHRSGHAEIYREHDRVYILDLGSYHGTFLNGERLLPNAGMELHDSDIISVVDTEFVYYEVRTGA